MQLYDMATDVGEQTNVAAEHPDVVERLTLLLERYVVAGRSTPGVPQDDDVPVDIRKHDENAGSRRGGDAD